jgi:hypothetical protein
MFIVGAARPGPTPQELNVRQENEKVQEREQWILRRYSFMIRRLFALSKIRRRTISSWKSSTRRIGKKVCSSPDDWCLETSLNTKYTRDLFMVAPRFLAYTRSDKSKGDHYYRLTLTLAFDSYCAQGSNCYQLSGRSRYEE